MVLRKKWPLDQMKIYLLAFLFLFCGCKEEKKAPSFKIVCSFSVLSDFVQNVTRNVPVTIKTLVPEDRDPHTYELRPSEIKEIEEASIVVINGLGLEGGMGRLFSASQKVIMATRNVASILGDPHAWHDVERAQKYVEEIRDQLSFYDPIHKKLYALNAKIYLHKLKGLHAKIKKQFEEIPQGKRLVITTHDAFAYYGKAYQVQFLSPIGLNTQEEPSAVKILGLIKLIKEKKIKALFLENLASSKVIQQIANETGVSVSGVLYADGLSRGGDANTYIKMMESNTNEIFKALKGK